MFETILVPIDGSSHAGEAVLIASDIAENYASRVVLIHVLREGQVSAPLRQMVHDEDKSTAAEDRSSPLSNEGRFPLSARLGATPDRDKRVEQALGHLADSILGNAKHVAHGKDGQKVRSVVADGAPSDQVLTQSKLENADLIVMGGRGPSDVEGFRVGSVSHKGSQMSACTSVVVK